MDSGTRAIHLTSVWTRTQSASTMEAAPIPANARMVTWRKRESAVRSPFFKSVFHVFNGDWDQRVSRFLPIELRKMATCFVLEINSWAKPISPRRWTHLETCMFTMKIGNWLSLPPTGVPAGGACSDPSECVSNAVCAGDPSTCTCNTGFVTDANGYCSEFA